LEAQNHVLIAENERLRKALGLPVGENVEKQEIVALEKENPILEAAASVNK
jgi:hypothetical protein